MIKKSTAIILTILILSNSIGCYMYSQIEKEDVAKLERDDNVKITTMDGKEYYLTRIKLQEPILKGHVNKYGFSINLKNTDIEQITIPTEEIKEIKVDKINPYLTVVTVVFFINFIYISTHKEAAFWF